MSSISGSAMTKAIVDLRRTNFFIVMRRRAGDGPVRLTASAIRSRSQGCALNTSALSGGAVSARRLPLRSLTLAVSDAHETFEFRGGPADRFVDRLAALGALGDHLGHGRLIVHLVGDPHRCGRSGDRDDLILPRRIVVYGPLGGAFLRPGLEV